MTSDSSVPSPQTGWLANWAKSARRPLAWLPPALVVGGLFPLLLIVPELWRDNLANPFQWATLQSGFLALLLLLLSLTCTPLRLLTGWTWPARIRKTLGMLAFAYACLHLVIYLVDHADIAILWDDLQKRAFIVVGMLALLLLLPLALTSSKKAVRRLGFVRWTWLHRLVYVSVSLGALHFFWAVKKDKTTPLLFVGYLALLWGYRLWHGLVARRKRASTQRN